MNMLDQPLEEHDDKTTFGFWVYLMTDLVLFASLFATFAVLRHNVAGGPSLSSLFSLPYAFMETLLLLTSSFACGLAVVAGRLGSRRWLVAGLLVTFALGIGFLGMELHEFSTLAHDGNGWRQNAALSSFFTLVATHGAHITVGLLWLVFSLKETAVKGLSKPTLRRLTLFSLFWHFLDIVWIFIFSFVYLIGGIV